MQRLEGLHIESQQSTLGCDFLHHAQPALGREGEGTVVGRLVYIQPCVILPHVPGIY